MLDLLFTRPEVFFLLFPSLLIALTIHEFSHAFVADQLGDPTPRIQGRVTLNPLAHLDPLGTLAMLLTRFGWGKPVEFDPYNLKHPTRDAALIAAAGPASNIVLAIICTIVLRILPIDSQIITFALMQMVVLNIGLAVFNCIPVAPLDGEKILYALLPKETAFEYRQFMEKYGTLVLIVLIFPIFGSSSPISQLVNPIVQTIIRVLLG